MQRLDSPLLTRDEAAGYCRVGLRTFDRRVAPHVRALSIGARRLFDRRDIDTWLETQKDGRFTRDRRTGVYTVRFTHRGRRQHRSTGVRDLAGAKVEAARIYAETISGRRLQSRQRDLRPLDVLFAEWLTQIESEIAPESWKTFRGYCTNHFLPFFESAERLTVSSVEDYSRMRLRQSNDHRREGALCPSELPRLGRTPRRNR